MTAQPDGWGARTPTCESCGAFAQRVAGRWRCPWVTASDAEPAAGSDWPCGRPYERSREAATERAFGAASTPKAIAR